MKLFIRIFTLLVGVFFSMPHVQASVVQGCLIETPQGSKQVEELKIGDEILGYDETKGAPLQ